VIIVGGRHFTNYPLLRVTLDALLANRLPDVELLTTGAPGVALLAASCATERGLAVTALVPDFRRLRVDALGRRDAFRVSAADATVVVWDQRAPNPRRVLALVEKKGIPIHVLGGHPRRKVRHTEEPEEDPRRELPDSKNYS